MAGAAGEDAPDLALLDELERDPHSFEFFALLRRLECVYAQGPRLGRSSRPREDAIRLGQTPSLAFAPTEMLELRRGAQGRRHRLRQAFFGLFGPNGPLPLHLTEYARQRELSRDPTFARFADLFHHRLLSLFFRAWSASQPCVEYDRPDEDRFRVYVAALMGMSAETFAADPVAHSARLFRAGLFSAQSRHREGLQNLLAHHFGLPVRVEEFVGEWMPLPHEARLHLGRDPHTATLGRSSVLGARVWGVQNRFRVHCGPLDLAHFLRLLPIGDGLAALASLVRQYVGLEQAWDLRLSLRHEEVPATRLGEQGRLGWTTWLTPRRTRDDADDLLLGATTIEQYTRHQAGAAGPGPAAASAAAPSPAALGAGSAREDNGARENG